jgi:Tfp pilus assembly protein PilW
MTLLRTVRRASQVRQWKTAIGGRLSCERGFTLIEALIAIPCAIVVVGIPLLILISAFGGQNAISSQSVATRQAETGLEQLTRDLRQATGATISSSAGGLSASATLTLPVRTSTPSLTSIPATQQVRWACTAGATCTRQVGSGSTVELISGVVTACFDTSSTNNCGAGVSASNPAYLYLAIQARVTSQLPNGSGSAVSGLTTPITLRDGVDLRNFS